MKKRPSIVTVTVEGRDEKSPAGQDRRLRLVDKIGEWLATPGINMPDAVVFPGGFGFLPDHENLEHRLADAATRMAARLKKNGLSPQIVMGFDTAPHKISGRLAGGQQLAMAFNAKGLSGFARKIFPVGEDVDGRTMPPMLLQQDDYDDPRRVIELPYGGRALLCVCYDMFGIADAVRNNPARLEKFAGPGSNISFASFRKFLYAEKPDLAIATIHRFAKTGTDRFWQRHGIAAASAALGVLNARDSFAIAAAHLGRLRDDDFNACRLASWGVDERHLERGSKRRTETLAPHCAQIIAVPGSRALVRIFQP